MKLTQTCSAEPAFSFDVQKADHSVLRLLQISQQHIESQLDRVRHERELWKEVVDKRAQQPLQLALTLKDPHTGQAMQSLHSPTGSAGQHMTMTSPRPLAEAHAPPMGATMPMVPPPQPQG